MLGILATENVSTDQDIPVWWTYFGGPLVVGSIFTGIFAVIQTAINKKKAPPSIVEQTQQLLDGLQSMVSALTEDKVKDSERMTRLQNRIEELEASSQEDYAKISQLQEEKHEMQRELIRKSRMINELVSKLGELSILVEGIGENYSTTLKFKEIHND